MNLIITQICNRACPYCFAQSRARGEERGEAAPPFMSQDNFRFCLRFALRSGVQTLQVLGGEPTLHPEFADLLEMAAAEGMDARVFTNGLWPDAVCERMRGPLGPVAAAATEFPLQRQRAVAAAGRRSGRQARALAIVGPSGSCGFNIYREEFDLPFLAELIDAHKMHRSIRLGLAAPIVGKDNAHLPVESLRRIGRRLAEQTRQLDARDITVSPDCGFPLCMFDEADLGVMALSYGGALSRCWPVMDVGPDLTVWPCYPLGGLMNVKLSDFADRRELEEHYRVKLAPLRRMGMRDECYGCRHLQRERCCGGCAGYAVRRLAATG